MKKQTTDETNLNDHAFIIVMAEYGKAFLWGQQELKDKFIGECCVSYFPNMTDQPSPIPDELWQQFCDWHVQFEYVWFDYNDANLAFRDFDRTKPISFDWLEFHRMGISLAKQLKSILNDNVRVIYEIPAEDFTTKEFFRIEILKNGEIVRLILDKKSNQWKYDYSNPTSLAKFNQSQLQP
ncbi:hypothetical protein [Moraxella lacunata]|uniref:Uncharacterized protein n=1 Tax=Moraxella lacunata TaxID=477 RepID=A0A1V4H303_MORLA|nr:hypothetical protein [Moraxella lacunata]OPH39090.1 hypothetical protein B5J94_01705 [Moraxella lacunata]